MDARLAAITAAQGGVLASTDAARVDVSAVALDALVRTGDLVRVRRGAYVLRELHDAAGPEERYRLRTRAILRTRPRVDAASHHAAVLLHDVDTYGVDLGVVDIVSLVKSTRVRSGLRTHPGAGLTATTTHTHRVVTLPIALCQMVGGSGTVAAVCSMDDALHDHRCTLEQLRAAVALLPEHRQDAAERAIALTDVACESVGESRTRFLLRDLGFSLVSQHPLSGAQGFVGRVDFLVEGVVVVEFDGLVKYGGQDGRAALAAEKARESAIVDLGYEVVRLVWADLTRPGEVARRIREARVRALNRRQAMTAPAR
ncbi:MAG TPA: type IV toxin-antitoxin system AbiEi family antitoxin domain-containing protein [Ornithinibacter sp.]|nr:type IV toxin-antitoxin system AbiEi family antitoxin domain-containing protein [Ornithinibacter sp.]